MIKNFNVPFNISVTILSEAMHEKMMQNCHKKFNEMYGFDLTFEQYENMIEGLRKVENTPLNYSEIFRRVEEEYHPIPNENTIDIETVKLLMKIFDLKNSGEINKQRLEDINMYYWFYTELKNSESLQESIRGKSELFVLDKMIKMWNERKENINENSDKHI